MAKALIYEFEFNNGANKMQLFENRVVMISRVGLVIVAPISKIKQLRRVQGALTISFGTGTQELSIPLTPNGTVDQFFLHLQELL